MEQTALKICSAFFEKVGFTSQESSTFLTEVLRGIFTSLHFYRNKTRSNVIPSAIMKCVHVFFSTLMVCHGSATLVQACDSIQRGILFMVLKSESAAIKHVTSPSRDKKYAIVAYSRLMSEFADSQDVDNESLKQLASGLIDLAATLKVGFTMASAVEKSGEELIMDGAID